MSLVTVADNARRNRLSKAVVLHQGENKTSLAAGVKPLAGGGGIFKSAAVEVLRRERRLMTTGDITK